MSSTLVCHLLKNWHMIRETFHFDKIKLINTIELFKNKMTVLQFCKKFNQTWADKTFVNAVS